jgi:cytoskeletal protein RodZ
MPLIITLVVVVVAVIGGGILLGINLSKDDPEGPTTEAAGETSEAEAETSAAEETSEAAEETTEEATEGESVYRVPVEGECIENVETGFYVVDCESEDAYWSVLKIVQSPADPDPSDPYHTVAATDACEGSGHTQYYYTDTAIAAGRDWDPEIDSITAVYCVKQV